MSVGFDEKWDTAKPNKWGKRKYSNERKMLKKVLSADEEILAMLHGKLVIVAVGGKKGRGGLEPVGVAAATSKHLLFLSKDIPEEAAMQITYEEVISKITHSTGWLSGEIEMDVVSGTDTVSLKIRDIIKEDVKPFVDAVNKRLKKEPAPVSSATSKPNRQRAEGYAARGGSASRDTVSKDARTESGSRSSSSSRSDRPETGSDATGEELTLEAVMLMIAQEQARTNELLEGILLSMDQNSVHLQDQTEKLERAILAVETEVRDGFLRRSMGMPF